MSTTILHSDFKTLRQAYSEIKCFIENELGDEVHSLKTKIDEDLGCAGDDNLELLEKFINKYHLDTTGFDYSKHFLSEGEIFNSGIKLVRIVSIPVMLTTWLIKVFSFGKYDWTNKKLLHSFNRETTDMTFGDMLTWYLAGKYNLRKDMTIAISNHSSC